MKSLLITLILATGVCSSTKNKIYCNGRFDFCFQYPPDFVKQEVSENGDGAFFMSRDKTSEIWAWGSLAVEGGVENLDQEFKIYTDSLQITYKVRRDDSFIFSGIVKEGKIVYQKTVEKNIDYLGDKNTPVFQSLRIVYPKNKEARYRTYCSVIAQSLKTAR